MLVSVQARADELVVSAAASLTNAFKSVSDAFEQPHPGTKVLLNVGASDVLMQQIVKGAPADVFASADQKAMDKAAAEKVIVPATRRDFAANSLVLIVPADSRFAPAALNEPFSALDSALRQRMRRELLDRQARLDIPLVLITHDPDDVAAFGDQVVQVSDGCVRENQAFTGYARSGA